MAGKWAAAVGLALLWAAFCLESRADGPLRVRASGVGYAPPWVAGTPRGRLMAERAAKLVAMRNLAVGGARLPYGTSVRAVLPGVKVVRMGRMPDGGVSATVETTRPVWRVREKIIVWYPR